MAKCGPNRKKVQLDDGGECGFKTAAKAKEAGRQTAKSAVLAEGGCTGSCPQPKNMNLACQRVAPDDEIECAVKVYSYTNEDGGTEFGWYLDGMVSTRCVCFPYQEPVVTSW